MNSRQWVGVVLVGICGVGLALYLVRYPLQAAPPAADTTPASPVVTVPFPRASEVTVSAAPAGEKRVPPSEAMRLIIPGVVSARIGGAILPNADNALKPPTYTEAYRWAARGQPGCPSRDTVYILGHTVRAGGGVFDKLQTVRRGQLVVLRTETGVIRYKVQSTKLYGKDEINDEQHVYDRIPNRLILVGCYLNPDGSLQTRNFVVTARAVSC